MKITLPKPPSLNHLYGYNRYTGARYIKEEGKSWFEEAGYIVNRQYLDILVGEVTIKMKFFYCGSGDLDNILKASFDLLAKQGVIENDKQIKRLEIEKFRVPHREDQKLEIEIDEII